MPYLFTQGELEDHYRYLRRVAADLIQDDNLADDAVQAVMLQTLQRERGSIASLRAWSRAVLRNGIFAIRRRRAQVRDLERLNARDESFDDHRAEIRLFREEVAETVELLHEPYRTTIEMRYLRELSIEEIARKLDVSVETVRTQLRRGRDKLRASLEPRYSRERFQGLLFLLVHDRRLAPMPPFATAKLVLAGVVATAGAASVVWMMNHSGHSERPAVARLESRPDDPTASARHGTRTAEAVAPPRRIPLSTPPEANVKPGTEPVTFAVPFRLRTAAGVPLPGSRVVFASDRGLGPNEVPAHATSGVDGRGVVHGVRGWGALRLDEPGWLPLRGAMIEGGAPGSELELVYVESREVHGLVHDTEGEPIEDVRVRADVPRPKLPPGSRYRRAEWQRGPNRTDAQGHFTILLPRFDSVELIFESRDHAVTRRPIAADDEDEISSPVILRPRKTAWSIRLLSPDGRPATDGLASLGGGVVRSTPGGFFTFDDPGPGSELIAATSEGYGIWHDVDRDRTDWQLHPAGHIEGIVTADGQPLPRARIWVADPTLLGNSTDFTSIESIFVGGRAFTTVAADARGRFALPVCHDRPYRLMAEHPGRPNRTQRFDVIAGDRVELDLSRRLVHARASGRVLDHEGRSIPGATVSWVNVRHQRMHRARRVGPIQGEEATRTLTDDEGAFTFADVPVVGATLFVHGTGIVPIERALGEETPVDLELVTERAAAFRIAGDEASSGARLVFLSPAGEPCPVWKDPSEEQRHPWMLDAPRTWLDVRSSPSWRTWYTAARANTLIVTTNSLDPTKRSLSLDPKTCTEITPSY